MITKAPHGVDSQYTINEAFFEAAMLNKKHDPWRIKRKSGLILADIEIVSCEHPDWWYAGFIGIVTMAELRFQSYSFGRFIREAKVVMLNGTSTYNTGRTISAKDFIIL